MKSACGSSLGKIIKVEFPNKFGITYVVTGLLPILEEFWQDLSILGFPGNFPSVVNTCSRPPPHQLLLVNEFGKGLDLQN